MTNANEVLEQVTLTALTEHEPVPSDIAVLLLEECQQNDEGAFTGFMGERSGAFLKNAEGTEMAVDLFGLRAALEGGGIELNERLVKWLLEEAPEVSWVLIQIVQ